jgi:hypothetical protein
MAWRFLLRILLSLFLIIAPLVYFDSNSRSSSGSDINLYGRQMLLYGIPIIILQLIILSFIWRAVLKKMNNIYKWILSPFVILYAFFICFSLGIYWADSASSYSGDPSGFFIIFILAPMGAIALSALFIKYLWK